MVEPRKVAPRADNASPHAGAQVAWLLVVLALIVALGVAALAVGSRPRLPAPFGPARNGAIVYGSTDGDIYASTRQPAPSTAIITGADRRRDARFRTQRLDFRVRSRNTIEPEEGC